jgi:IS5 family transposase
MLVLTSLYGLSDRATEAHVNDSLSAKWFLGLAVDEPAPDRSTLTAFRRRIRRRGGEGYLQELLEEIVAQAASAGVRFRLAQTADSSHGVADADVAEEK